MQDVDEVHVGEVTRPETLAGLCDGIDVVFSSIGITRQKDGLTFRDVDYQGNLNLLEQAMQAGVSKFVYVSALDGPELLHLDIVRAHEDFVAALAGSGLAHTVVRPTGYFSDVSEFFAMARKGRVYLLGDGENRVNPIHGADLAVRCADAVETDSREMAVGGPETFTWRQIAELAFTVQGKPARITHVPLWAMSLATSAVRPFSRHNAGLMAFFTAMATRDAVGPPTGTHRLETFFRELLSG